DYYCYSGDHNNRVF
nr:immunoglobulin light chain junction region [Macaca mulatta]